MGVYELQPLPTPAMHWQHHQEERLGYDPSRDLSPNLPCQDSSSSSGSTTTTTTGGAATGVTCCSATPCCKQEPCPSPKPPVMCAGCKSPITDRFYLFAVDRQWHASCLQCSQCRAPLDREVTCFARDGSIFCKKDYYRLFGVRRCGRCGAGISSSELVMRAREQVYHVGCFSCAVCAGLLTKGDTFGMRDGAVFCRLHYEPAPLDAGSPSALEPRGYLSYSAADRPSDLKAPPLQHGQSFYNGTPTPPRQKGRPRKRKPKDVDAITASLADLGNDSTGYLDFGGSLSNGGGHQRTKRMRTSFKHHQLRTMKSYFAINHNPDAKDLKQLSQKTGLPKRVLQVWFQNARAKWRRMLSKQDGGGAIKDKCSEPGMDSSASFHSASPSSYLTPSPLECSS